MPTLPTPMAGEIWDLQFTPHVGREQAGFRPAMVISNDYYNLTPNGLIIVVPITATDRGIRYHVRLEPPEGGLTKPSVLMCDQVRVQSTHRFIRLKGTVSPATLQAVQRMVGSFIDC